MKVYGPYYRKDGRQHIILVHENGRKQTVSYPRYLMEIKLGRSLEIDEEVDHIDGDKLNNDLSNLQILSKKENAQKAIIETNRQAKIEVYICLCGKEFKRDLREVNGNRNKGKVGPFCSRSCAGIFTHKDHWNDGKVS